MVLPFGLSLSPRVCTKVEEGALVPLREQGVRILNYLDDWLILAQSQDQSDAEDLFSLYGGWIWSNRQHASQRNMLSRCWTAWIRSKAGQRSHWNIFRGSWGIWLLLRQARLLLPPHHRLGCHVQPASSLGGVDGPPTAVAYQLPRVVSSAPCLEPSQRALTRQACTGPYGQHCNRCVHQLTRWFALPLHFRNSPATSSSGDRSIWGHFVPFIIQVCSTVRQTSCHELHSRENGDCIHSHRHCAKSAPPGRFLWGGSTDSERGTLWHPRPNLWKLHVWSLDGTWRF